MLDAQKQSVENNAQGDEQIGKRVQYHVLQTLSNFLK